MASIQTIITCIALFVASISILLELKMPSFQFIFTDQHGSPLELIKGKHIPLGINQEKQLCYLPYSPSNWNIIIKNTGNKVAENILFELSIDGVSFRDQSFIYKVKNFEYGLGTYSSLVFDTDYTLKPGESICLPKIPFTYCEHSLSHNQITSIHITIYCNDIEVVKKSFNAIAILDDIGDSNNIDEIVYDTELINEMYHFFNHQPSNFSYIDYLNLDPYTCTISKDKVDIYHKIYQKYLNNTFTEYSSFPITREIVSNKYRNGMKSRIIFWGRIYYLSKDYNIEQVELLVTNDLIHL